MKNFLLSPARKKLRLLLLGDLLVLSFAILLSYSIRILIFYGKFDVEILLAKIDLKLILVLLIQLFSLYLFGQYSQGREIPFARKAVMQLLSIWFAGLFLSGVLFFFPKYIFGRQVLLTNLVVVSVMLLFWRLTIAELLLNSARPKRLAVLGNNQIVVSFVEALPRLASADFSINSVFLSNNSSAAEAILPDSVNRYESLPDLLDSDDFDALAFDATNGVFTNDEVRRMLELKYRGKAVYDLPRMYENLTGKVPLAYIDGRWLLNSDGLQGETNVFYGRLKRSIDLFLSLLFFLIFLPIFPVIALAVKLSSPGGIFFVQERLGRHQVPFNCIKFRTMDKDAEAKSGPHWAGIDDPRVTRVGRFLRKSRLDELPQLWNILKGEMSFVGPRPIRRHFAAQLAEQIPFYELRFGVKPGLTGWAQVNYDYAGSLKEQLEKFQYELFYIQNMSFTLDLLTTLKTVKKVLRGGGGL